MPEMWLWLITPPNKGFVPSTIKNKQHKTLINQIDTWFRGLALPEDLSTVMDPRSDEGLRLRIADKLDSLIAQVFKVCERAS